LEDERNRDRRNETTSEYNIETALKRQRYFDVILTCCLISSIPVPLIFQSVKIYTVEITMLVPGLLQGPDPERRCDLLLRARNLVGPLVCAGDSVVKVSESQPGCLSIAKQRPPSTTAATCIALNSNRTHATSTDLSPSPNCACSAARPRPPRAVFSRPVAGPPAQGS
jgi:hypothetical protein